MTGTQSPKLVQTKLERIGELAREKPELVFTSVAHLVDGGLLNLAMNRTRKDGAPGVDGMTWNSWWRDRYEHMPRLVNELKSGTYKAPHLRRAYIPKADGSKRPIAITTVEDKILQRAVAMVMEAIYEQDFYAFSYGFRPGKSAQQALREARRKILDKRGAWIVEVDIKSFFDTIDHRKLREVLDLRIRDGVIRRMIDKWMRAGILEGEVVTSIRRGTPQGGVISPLLANILLHEVLDKWFVEQVKPRMRGGAEMIRFADDFIIMVDRKDDAERVYDVVPKRLERYGLTAHPEKSRIVPFFPPSRQRGARGTFTFLGFTFYWAKTRRGGWSVLRKTSAKKFTKGLAELSEAVKKARHKPLQVQQQMLNEKLQGHMSYFGIGGNTRSLRKYFREVRRIWFKWLKRRAQRRVLTWKAFAPILRRYPLIKPRIVHPNV